VSEADAQEVADDYGDAQIQGLKRAIGAVVILALLSLWFTRRLPGREGVARAPGRRSHLTHNCSSSAPRSRFAW